MGVLFTYSGSAAKTKEKIEEGRKDIAINTIYRHSNGFYWKINARGYIHIIMPSKVTLDGEFKHYTIKDELLTKDNMLKVVGTFGRFGTIRECIHEIERNL